MDPNVGTSHGKQSWLRWDASTAACAIVVGALALLFLIHINFRASASAGISR